MVLRKSDSHGMNDELERFQQLLQRQLVERYRLFTNGIIMYCARLHGLVEAGALRSEARWWLEPQ